MIGIILIIQNKFNYNKKKLNHFLKIVFNFKFKEILFALYARKLYKIQLVLIILDIFFVLNALIIILINMKNVLLQEFNVMLIICIKYIQMNEFYYNYD